MAKNRIFESGKLLSVATASTVLSGDPVIVGAMAGVAQTDYDSSIGETTIDFGGVYDLSVKAVDNAGNSAVAIGDPIYYVTGDTPVLSKKRSGTLFGYALETITSGSTDTIRIRCFGGDPRANGYYGAGVFISAEVTGTGSNQNTAHGLGTTPSAVVVVPTEFLSSQSVDITEGTHTSTNVVVSVAAGVKYKILAYK